MQNKTKYFIINKYSTRILFLHFIIIFISGCSSNANTAPIERMEHIIYKRSGSINTVDAGNYQENYLQSNNSSMNHTSKNSTNKNTINKNSGSATLNHDPNTYETFINHDDKMIVTKPGISFDDENDHNYQDRGRGVNNQYYTSSPHSSSNLETHENFQKNLDSEMHYQSEYRVNNKNKTNASTVNLNNIQDNTQQEPTHKKPFDRQYDSNTENTEYESFEELQKELEKKFIQKQNINTLNIQHTSQKDVNKSIKNDTSNLIIVNTDKNNTLSTKPNENQSSKDIINIDKLKNDKLKNDKLNNNKKLSVDSQVTSNDKLVFTNSISNAGNKTIKKTDINKKIDKFRTKNPLSSVEFIWPLNGKIIKRYSKDEANYNEGINIGTEINTDIRAAGDGVVKYIGNLPKYGKLIILEHKNGYLTGYAHNNQILVEKNDEIVQGQIIAKVGQTGSVETPQLHFSISKNKTTLDPEKQID